ncbi:MAG: protein-glutamate O-methyltransferase CheR [Gammaproteobacteria bacterium]|nr:protein-glutamate O-methyltransferase CheR [Gammaproteobacteria bacterium]
MQSSQPIQLDGHIDALLQEDLQRIIKFIDREVGIQLSASKHTLVAGRLRRRLYKLGYKSYSDYLSYVLDKTEGKHERLHLIDALTTNKTDFFREPTHFRYLIDQALPELQHQGKQNGRRELHIWSAGCSSGEEAYTLAIVLNEALEQSVGMRFSILATDISASSLDTARSAVYPEQRIQPVPHAIRKKYFLRSSDPAEALVQMGPKLRDRVRFASLNLMSRNFNLAEKMDVIFCRNVLIYFNTETRTNLIHRFEQQLAPGGYLFVGHSESLNGLNTSLQPVAPMVYRKSAGGGVR